VGPFAEGDAWQAAGQPDSIAKQEGSYMLGANFFLEGMLRICYKFRTALVLKGWKRGRYAVDEYINPHAQGGSG
jgi:hypothetical protein